MTTLLEAKVADRRRRREMENLKWFKIKRGKKSSNGDRGGQGGRSGGGIASGIQVTFNNGLTLGRKKVGGSNARDHSGEG